MTRHTPGSSKLLFFICVLKQWVAQSCEDDQHEYAHLSDTIVRLKAFNAKRKWRAVAAVVMLGARFGVKKRNRSASEEDRGENGCESVLDSMMGSSKRQGRSGFPCVV